MKHVELQTCMACKGERYAPVYLRRPDGFFDRVWAECGTCEGKGYVEHTWSDTPLVDYVREDISKNSRIFNVSP